MHIIPILHRVLVKPDRLEDRDKTFAAAASVGIILDFASEHSREQQAIDVGTVMDFGPTAFRDFGAENPLQVGDKIIFAKYGGKAVVDPETKTRYVLLNDEDVIAILKEGA